MTKKEYTLKSLSSALEKLKEASDQLVTIPSLKEKTDALYKEAQKEYERLYNENDIQ